MPRPDPPNPHSGACRYDLVMFDLDGTLVATSAELADAVNDSLANAGLASVAQDRIDRWIGHGTRELVVQALAHVRGLSAEAVRTSPALLDPLVESFDGHYLRRCGTRSQVYPQVRETLAGLRARGVRLAVVTNKDGRFTSALLRAHGLAPLFDRVVSGDTVARKKPDPEGILSCLQTFGVSAERALFVGDSSVDVATARHAGVSAWAVPYGYNMGQPVASCAPDRLIGTLAELLEPASA